MLVICIIIVFKSRFLIDFILNWVCVNVFIVFIFFWNKKYVSSYVFGIVCLIFVYCIFLVLSISC